MCTKRQREYTEAIEKRDAIIYHLVDVIEKTSPEQCEAVSPKTGFYCLKPATHYYANCALCNSCAQKFIDRGANPAPFPIPSQRNLSQQICTA